MTLYVLLRNIILITVSTTTYGHRLRVMASAINRGGTTLARIRDFIGHAITIASRLANATPTRTVPRLIIRAIAILTSPSF